MYGNAKCDPSYDQTGNAKLGAAICAGSPVAESPINSLLNEVRYAQNETHDLISQLEARLGLVLVPMPPSVGGTKGDEAQPVRSPLCDELALRVAVEASAHNRLRAIIAGLSI